VVTEVRRADTGPGRRPGPRGKARTRWGALARRAAARDDALSQEEAGQAAPSMPERIASPIVSAPVAKKDGG
jgi:hypothetical protein